MGCLYSFSWNKGWTDIKGAIQGAIRCYITPPRNLMRENKIMKFVIKPVMASHCIMHTYNHTSYLFKYVHFNIHVVIYNIVIHTYILLTNLLIYQFPLYTCTLNGTHDDYYHNVSTNIPCNFIEIYYAFSLTT